MKHLLKKIALIVPVVAIVAAFVMPGISRADVSLSSIKITAPTIIARTATSITLESTITYTTSSPSVNKQYKVANKDINFAYRKNNGSETKIPLTASNAKDIYYDTPTKISAKLSSMDPNATYQGYFTEDSTTPDTKSSFISFWVDTVSLAGGSVKDIVEDKDNPGYFKVTAVANNIFKNTSVASTTLVPSFSLVARLYDASNTLLSEQDPVNSTSATKYNTPYEISWGWLNLRPGTTYKVVFVEKVRNALSTAFNFTTPALPAGTTSGSTSGTTTSGSSTSGTTSSGTSSGTGSTQTSSGTTIGITGIGSTPSSGSSTSGTTSSGTSSGTGTTQTSSGTSASGITTTFTASPVYVTNYSGGMDAVKVNAFVKYTNPNKTISLATAQAGTILINLVDKNGAIKYVDEIDLSNYDTVYDKDIPLDSIMLAVGNSLDPTVEPRPIFKASDAPFTIKIIETKLDVRSSAFSVAMPGSSGSSSASSSSSNTSSGQESSAISANGTKATFKISSADLTKKLGSDGKETMTGVISGHIIYDKVVNNDAKRNKIVAEIYDDNNPPRRVATGNLSQEAVTSYDIEFSGTFPRLDPASGSFTFKIKDNDLGVSSQEFTFAQSGSGGMVLQNGGYAPADAKTGTMPDGTKVAFGDIALKSHDDSSATFETTVTYTNTAKGAQAVTGSVIKTVLLNADGSVNGGGTVPTINAKYGQPATVSFKVSRLDPTKKFALQFVEGSSTAQTGKFTFQLDTIDQDLANPPGDDADSPASDALDGRTRFSNPTPFDSIPEIVTALVDNVVIPIAVPFLALAIIYTGFMFVRARGNPGKIDEAKKALMWTLAGGALILGAYVISLALQGTINDIMGM